MSATQATKLKRLLNRLKREHKAPEEPPTTSDADPIEQFIYSFLLWESTSAKARAAMSRILNSVVSLNELRVCLTDEIVTMLGERYPRVEERARRLRSALHAIYLAEHAITLQPLHTMTKREARQRLMSFEGVPEYVAARVVLVSLGGHAMPVDEHLLGKLVEEGVFEEGIEIEKATSILERCVRAADSHEAHQLFQAWSEDSSSRRSRKSGAEPKAAASKNKAASKATRSTGRKKTAQKKVKKTADR